MFSLIYTIVANYISVVDIPIESRKLEDVDDKNLDAKKSPIQY